MQYFHILTIFSLAIIRFQAIHRSLLKATSIQFLIDYLRIWFLDYIGQEKNHFVRPSYEMYDNSNTAYIKLMEEILGDETSQTVFNYLLP